MRSFSPSVAILRAQSLNALRAPGYDAVELQESLRFGEASQDELERREAVRRTLAGLAALLERQREALLRTVEGAAHADIARDLALRPPALPGTIGGGRNPPFLTLSPHPIGPTGRVRRGEGRLTLSHPFASPERVGAVRVT